MKLRISTKAIKAAVDPYQFNMIDVLSIVPCITVGQFEGCAVNLVNKQTLVVTNGIILVYNKLEDFLSGLEPISLVEDDSIYYDQELSTIDFQINPEPKEGADAGAISKVHNLMFGARVDESEAEAIQTEQQSTSLP